MRHFLVSLLFLSLFFSVSAQAENSEVDMLVKILANKGIITQEEAEAVLTEVQKAIKEQKAEVKKEISASAPKSYTYKGDFRYRYQTQKRQPTVGRNFERIRFRYGFETAVNDEFKFGARMTTGSTTQQRSYNQTLTDVFKKKEFVLDMAYATWSKNFRGIDSFWMTAGKFAQPFYTATELIFCTDITFEGAALHFEKNNDKKSKFFFNAGYFILDEYATSDKDPEFFVSQIGMNHSFTKNATLTLAATAYNYAHIQGENTLEAAVPTNTMISAAIGKYKYDYDTIGWSACYKNKFNYGKNPFALSVYGDYIDNQDVTDADTAQGFCYGIRYGHDKISTRHSWQLSADRRKLETDAVLDIFPDPNFYSGRTNSKSNRVSFKYQLQKNLTLETHFFRNYSATGVKNSEDLNQFQLIWAF